MRLRFMVVVFAAMLTSACGEKEGEKEVYDPARDYFSFANTGQFVTQHLELDLTVDFEAAELQGSAVHTMQRVESGGVEVVLDTRDLAVTDVQILLTDGVSLVADYRFGESGCDQGNAINRQPAGARPVGNKSSGLNSSIRPAPIRRHCSGYRRA